MRLLAKVDIVDDLPVYYYFDKILESGYNIKEDNDRITQKFANGNRKQFISSYTDVIITITFDTDDTETTKQYLSKLTNGYYSYFSIKDKTSKTAYFIIQERPNLIAKRSITANPTVEQYQVTLLRAGV